MEDARRRRRDRGSRAAADRPRPARHRAGGAGDEEALVLAARRHRHERHLRHRDRALGHLRQVARRAGLAAARRQGARQGAGLYPSRPRRHARGLRDARRGAAGRARAGDRREGLHRLQGGVHPLHPLPRPGRRGRQGGADDGGAPRGGRRRHRDHGRLPRPAGLGRGGARLYRGAGAGAADVRRGGRCRRAIRPGSRPSRRRPGCRSPPASG